MVLPATVRSEKLRTLRADDTKVIGKQKLFYKGNTSTFNVYQIDLDWLIYNRHNGRIESEMLSCSFDRCSMEQDTAFDFTNEGFQDDQI
jgi:hypothetical protein